MNNFKKYSIFLVLLIVGICGYVKESKAAILYQQSISSATSSQNQSSGAGQMIGQVTGTYNSATLNFSTNDTQLFLELRACSFANGVGCSVESTSGILTVPASELDLTLFKTRSFTFGTASFASTTAYYRLSLETVTAGKFYRLAGSDNANAYPNGTVLGPTDIEDAFFQIGTNLIAQNTLVISYPANGSAVPSFSTWSVTYNLTATTTGDIVLRVNYGTTTNFGLTDSIYLLQSSPDSPPFNKFGEQIVFKNAIGLPAGDYFAKAEAEIRTFTGLTYVFASSSIISFALTEFSAPFYDFHATSTFDGGTFGFATTTGDIFAQCEQLGVNGWQTAVCNVLSFLFKPHSIVINTLQNVLLSFKTTFPFSVFFNFNQYVQNALANSPSGQTFTLPLPLPNGANVNLLTPTMLTDTVGAATKNKWFELSENLIWIGTGLAIIFTII